MMRLSDRKSRGGDAVTITPFRVVDVMEAAWAAERAGRSIVHRDQLNTGFMLGGLLPTFVTLLSPSVADIPGEADAAHRRSVVIFLTAGGASRRPGSRRRR